MQQQGGDVDTAVFGLDGFGIGAAGTGNALGSLLGNRKRMPEPEVIATAVAALAVSAALLTALFYSLWTLLAVGLAAGMFGQLAKLSLDALIQREVEDRMRARVFSWSETILQASWVIGGALGIALPLNPALGFGVITAVVIGAFLLALRSRQVGRVPMPAPGPGSPPPG